ncbi:hypothetical protein SPADD19_00042 [Streptococcus parasanguinis]|nr:hypothetical protein SPADD19_00042 [Streptococcus parasanguinis]
MNQLDLIKAIIGGALLQGIANMLVFSIFAHESTILSW